MMRASIVLVLAILFAVGCTRGPLSFGVEESGDESAASSTAGDSEDSSTDPPKDVPPGDGDGDPSGDGDGEPPGDGDGEPPGDGDGDSGPICGNGAIDEGEQCDGNNLNRFDCKALGYSSGTLACDPVVCTFDASMCTSEDPPWGTTG